MNAIMTVWGLVLLIIFGGAHYAAQQGLLAANWLWIVIAIIFVIMNVAMGKKMKDAPKGSKETWLSITAFGFITTLIVALGYLPLPLWWLMSLWLLLFGAGLFAEGHAMNGHLWNYTGLVLVFAALFVSGFGDQWYFMAGALFLGLLGLINGLLTPGGPPAAKK